MSVQKPKLPKDVIAIQTAMLVGLLISALFNLKLSWALAIGCLVGVMWFANDEYLKHELLKQEKQEKQNEN